MASIPNADVPRLDGVIPGEPTLDDVKNWLRLPSADTLDDVAMQVSLDAAVEWQRRHLHFPTDAAGATYYPPDLVLAVYLRVARWLSRRSSPDMISGFGEFGPVRIGSIDRDITALENSHKPTVFA